MESNEQHDFLKVKEAAVILRITERALYNMIRAGKVPHKRIGGAIRIPQSYIQEYEQEDEEKALQK